MKVIVYIFTVSLLFMGCDSLVETNIIDVKASMRFSPDMPYRANDSNGTFREEASIDPSIIVDEVEDFNTSFIREVNISSINIRIEAEANNQADRILLNGFYEDGIAPAVSVFSNFIFTASDYSGTAMLPVSGYEISGIRTLSSKLLNIVRGNDFGVFTISVEGFSVDASGNPSGSPINLTIYAEVEAEAIFEEEVEIPSFP